MKYFFVPLAAYFGLEMTKNEGFLKKMAVKVNFRNKTSFWLDFIGSRGLVVTLLYIRTAGKYFFVALAAYFGPKLPKNEEFLKKMGSSRLMFEVQS